MGLGNIQVVNHKLLFIVVLTEFLGSEWDLESQSTIPYLSSIDSCEIAIRNFKLRS